MTASTLVWLRQDLRLGDNPALHWAAGRGAVIPVYVFDDKDPYTPGGAAKWWLQEALQDLAGQFERTGVPLILRRGDAEKLIPALARESGADAVAWNRCCEPHARRRDENIAAILEQNNIQVHIANGGLLFAPEHIRTRSGTPFRVYTPFARACFAAPPPGESLPAPKKLRPGKKIPGDRLTDWRLVPAGARWTEGLAEAWTSGETAAQKQLKQFLQNN
ncbi:MAG: deoxyribodipyrimidine photo-lyase, partial [Bdellovibrionales bacterium]